MFGNLFTQNKKTDGMPDQPQSQSNVNSVSVEQSNTKNDTTTQTSAAVNTANGNTAASVSTASNSKVDPNLRQNLSALSHLDQRTTQVLQHAQEETKRIKQGLIQPEQLLIGLLYDGDIFKLLEEFQVDPAKLTRDIQAKEVAGNFNGQPTLSDKSRQAFEQAFRDAKVRNSAFITPEDLLLVLFNDQLPTAAYLQAQGVKRVQIEEKLSKSHGFVFGKKSVLEKFGVDLTQEAREGKLDPIAGRDKEIDRLTHILLRRTKNNPIIIGEAGVGKTAIVEGLAQSIVTGRVPKELLEKRIFQLDIAALVAGASHRGEFEERLKEVITEAMASNGTTIIFIDEIHTIIGTGEQEGSLDASNILKPHLARGHLQIIGTTTTIEYRKHFEKDKAFARRFQPVVCEEPAEDVAIEMIKILRPKYEAFHKVTVPDETIEAAVKLSKKYIGERYLPDKAVDLIDEAAADVKLQQSLGKSASNTVVKTHVEQVVSSWTGIPITKLTEDESAKLLELEKRIHQRMIDQEEAVVAVSEAVRRGRIGLASGQRPIASFIFLGSSGVGKTELAKTLAEILFGRDDAMIRLDMSEYMEKHEVAKLIGAPPGYVGYEEGGQLTEAVRAKPYSIVLMDEVEKAHPDVFNILLQLLEDGRLTDNKGNTISFKNTIVICTSNIGSAVIQQKLAEQDGKKLTSEEFNKQFKELTKLVGDELRKFFRPELINRFDDVVIFKPLRREDMAGVTRLGIEKTRKLLQEQGYDLAITQAAIERLSVEGYDPVYGARPLRRLIQTAVENPIALNIIGKKFKLGDTILIDYDSTKNEFTFTHPNQQGTVPLRQSSSNQGPTQDTNTKDASATSSGASTAQASPLPGTPTAGEQQPGVVTATEFDPMSVLGPDTNQQAPTQPSQQPQQFGGVPNAQAMPPGMMGNANPQMMYPVNAQMPQQPMGAYPVNGGFQQPVPGQNGYPVNPQAPMMPGGGMPPPYTGQGMQMNQYANNVPQGFYWAPVPDEQKVE